MDRFTLPDVTFAFSGPGAAAFIEANTITAFTYAAFGFILLLATVTFYFLRKKKGLLIVGFSVTVLAVHLRMAGESYIDSRKKFICGLSFRNRR